MTEREQIRKEVPASWSVSCRWRKTSRTAKESARLLLRRGRARTRVDELCQLATDARGEETKTSRPASGRPQSGISVAVMSLCSLSQRHEMCEKYTSATSEATVPDVPAQEGSSEVAGQKREDAHWTPSRCRRAVAISDPTRCDAGTRERWCWTGRLEEWQTVCTLPSWVVSEALRLRRRPASNR